MVNYQLKILQVMKAVGFTFNDFDFVINPLQFTGMDWNIHNGSGCHSDGVQSFLRSCLESDYSTSGQAHTITLYSVDFRVPLDTERRADAR
jgi:hypothetical protein